VSENRKYVVRESAIGQPIDQEGAVLDLGTGHFFRLSRTAMDIWAALSEPRELTEIAGDLARKYSGDTEVILTEVREHLQELERLGLIQRVGGTTG
jgi:hypothetical protein